MEYIRGIYRCPNCEHYCNVCGNLITLDYNFCVHCGEELNPKNKFKLIRIFHNIRKKLKKKWYYLDNKLQQNRDNLTRLNIEKEKVIKEQVKKMWLDAMRLKKLNQYTAAIQELNNVFKINVKDNSDHPNDEIAFEIAKLYNILKDKDSALKFLDLSLELDSEEPDVWYSKGMLLFKHFFDKENAKDCFYHALDLNPDYVDALYYMGVMQVELNNIKDAITSFDKVIKLSKNYENREYMDLFDELKREKGIKINKRKISLYCNNCETKLIKGKEGFYCPVCYVKDKDKIYSSDANKKTKKLSTNKDEYGGFWIRLIALILDYTLLFIIVLIINIISTKEVYNLLFDFNPSLLLKFIISMGTLPSLILILYFIVMDAWGGTLGKRICGLKVVTQEDKNIGPIKSIIRRIIWYISLIVFAFGFIWIGLDEKKQGWHDKAVGSFVKKR